MPATAVQESPSTALESHLPFNLVKIHNEPDGTFPNGIPNPMLLENQAVTTEAVLEHKADMGIAWDGDFDRCFLFDENGSLSRAITSSVCWPRAFSPRILAARSCMIRA